MGWLFRTRFMVPEEKHMEEQFGEEYRLYRESVRRWLQSDEAGMRFIGERIDVFFEGRSGFAKRPECPDGFRWGAEDYLIEECLSEWKDYARRGKMAHNMRPSHLKAAEKRGSRGVGKHYFRVRVSSGRVFDLYFDRAPESAQDREGGWYLLREMDPGETELPATG